MARRDYNWIADGEGDQGGPSPITREWTKSGKAGERQGPGDSVEAWNRLDFRPARPSQLHQEEDAPTFLLLLLRQKLDDVVDQNVRSFVQMVLSREFWKSQSLRLHEGEGEDF